MAHSSGTKYVFTFNWTIENVGMCAENALESPLWVSDGLDKTIWCLEMHPSNDDNDEESDLYTIHLSRRGHVSNPERISVKYTIRVGTDLPSKSSLEDIFSHDYKVGDSGSKHKFGHNRILFGDLEILTIRCCMWRNEKNILGKITKEKQSVASNLSLETVLDLDVLKERLRSNDLVGVKCRFAPVECCVRTQINVHRMSVTILLEKLCQDKLNNKLHVPIISAMQNIPSFILAIQISELRPQMSIEIRRIAEISSQHFVVCKITALNEEKSLVLRKSDKYLFRAEKTEDIWNFQNVFDTCAWRKLNLHCELAVSVKGEARSPVITQSFPMFN